MEELKQLRQLKNFMNLKGVQHMLNGSGEDFDVEGKIMDLELRSLLRKSTAEDSN